MTHGSVELPCPAPTTAGRRSSVDKSTVTRSCGAMRGHMVTEVTGSIPVVVRLVLPIHWHYPATWPSGPGRGLQPRERWFDSTRRLRVPALPRTGGGREARAPSRSPLGWDPCRAPGSCAAFADTALTADESRACPASGYGRLVGEGGRAPGLAAGCPDLPLISASISRRASSSSRAAISGGMRHLRHHSRNRARHDNLMSVFVLVTVSSGMRRS